MRIILSPAKKMREDPDFLAPAALPAFLPQTNQLLAALKERTPQQLQTLWRCSDAIAAQNLRRLETMDLTRNLTPALLSYEGIQYQYMAPGVLDDQSLAYVADHIRILSGFYGLLRPLDGVTPYRLEMGAKLALPGYKDLYAFWGSRLAQALAEETDLVLNLASKEYSKAVAPHLPSHVRFLTCVFGERKDGKITEKGTLCKMARGRMVRFLAQQQTESLEAVRQFAELGYRFDPEVSTETQYIFIKEES